MADHLQLPALDSYFSCFPPHVILCQSFCNESLNLHSALVRLRIAPEGWGSFNSASEAQVRMKR